MTLGGAAQVSDFSVRNPVENLILTFEQDYCYYNNYYYERKRSYC